MQENQQDQKIEAATPKTSTTSLLARAQQFVIEYLLLPIFALLYLLYIQIPLRIARAIVMTIVNVSLALLSKIAQLSLVKQVQTKLYNLLSILYNDLVVTVVQRAKTLAQAIYESPRVQQALTKAKEIATTNKYVLLAKEKVQIYGEKAQKWLQSAKTKVVSMVQQVQEPVMNFLQALAAKLVELQRAVVATKIAQQLSALLK